MVVSGPPERCEPRVLKSCPALTGLSVVSVFTSGLQITFLTASKAGCPFVPRLLGGALNPKPKPSILNLNPSKP